MPEEISRDVSRIAFLYDRSGEYEVWLGSLAEGAAGTPTQISHGLHARVADTVDWSPDGHTLAIGTFNDLGTQNQGARCWLVETRTGRFAPLTVPGMEQPGC